MTMATVRAAAEHVARAGIITSHQLAALSALDEALDDRQRQMFTELWRAEGSPAAPLQQTGGYGNPLQVPWFGQLDSATDQARRMCFSSSCAMMLAYLQPGSLKGPNGDDQYLQRVMRYGDTTEAAAQIQALASYGVQATFTQRASFGTIERQIAAGVPVPCGYLHRGPVDQPSGGGHWLIVVGHTPTHLIVHDPLGEADLVTGATIGGIARYCSYSRRNFGKRWMVEGAASGWAIIAER